MKNVFKKVIVVAILLWGSFPIEAIASQRNGQEDVETDTTQVKCKFCYNDGQLIGGNWILLDSIIVTKLYSNTSFFGYVFSSPNKQVTKILKEDALYVSYNDTLYINCHVAMDETLNCYSKAYLGKYDLVFFASKNVANKGVVAASAVGFGLIGGTMGFAASNITSQASSEKPYFWDMRQGFPISIDPKYMKDLLSKKKFLLKEYKNESKHDKKKPEVVMKYLQKIHILK